MSFVEFIDNHKEILWNWESVSANPNITWDDILRYDQIPWDFKGVSRNPNITIDILNTRPITEWSLKDLARNPNIISMNKIDQYYLSFLRQGNISLLGKQFSENPAVTWEFVQSHPYIGWDCTLLSKHPNITMDIISSNPQLPWNHRQLSSNPNICWDIINTHSNISWDFEKFSSNPGITVENIIDNLEYRQDTRAFYFNGKFIEMNWYCYGLSSNPNVTWKTVQESRDDEYYKRITWSYYYLSKNPNINMKVFHDNPDRYLCWSITNLAANPMDCYDWDKVVSRNSEPYILK